MLNATFTPLYLAIDISFKSSDSDMLHMGLLTEALFGREVVKRLPVNVKEWVTKI